LLNMSTTYPDIYLHLP